MYCLNSFVYFCQWNMHSCSHEYTNYTFCCFSGLGFLCIVSFYFVLASSKNNFVVFRIKTQGRISVVWSSSLVPHIQRKSTPQLDRSSHTLYSFFSLSIFSHNNNNNKSRNLFTEFLAFHCMLHLKTNKHGLWSFVVLICPNHRFFFKNCSVTYDKTSWNIRQQFLTCLCP